MRDGAQARPRRDCCGFGPLPQPEACVRVLPARRDNGEMEEPGGSPREVSGPPTEAAGSALSAFAGAALGLISDEHVCTVFGCWTSASRKTVVPIFEEHNHLLVYPV